MVSQKPEILCQIDDSLQRAFVSEDVWADGYAVGPTVTYYSIHDEIFLCFVFDVVAIVCLFVCALFSGEAAMATGRYERTGRRVG